MQNKEDFMISNKNECKHYHGSLFGFCNQQRIRGSKYCYYHTKIEKELMIPSVEYRINGRQPYYSLGKPKLWITSIPKKTRCKMESTEKTT